MAERKITITIERMFESIYISNEVDLKKLEDTIANAMQKVINNVEGITTINFLGKEHKLTLDDEICHCSRNMTHFKRDCHNNRN